MQRVMNCCLSSFFPLTKQCVLKRCRITAQTSPVDRRACDTQNHHPVGIDVYAVSTQSILYYLNLWRILHPRCATHRYKKERQKCSTLNNHHIAINATMIVNALPSPCHQINGRNELRISTAENLASRHKHRGCFSSMI